MRKFVLNILSISVVFLSLLSCKTKQCEYLDETYNEEWHHKIVKITESKSIKFLYLLETENGENLEIHLPQRVIMEGEIGDSIYKVKKSLFAFIYRNGKFEFVSRITSPTCDEFILNRKINFGKQGVNPCNLELKMIPSRFLNDSLFSHYMIKPINMEDLKNVTYVD